MDAPRREPDLPTLAVAGAWQSIHAATVGRAAVGKALFERRWEGSDILELAVAVFRRGSPSDRRGSSSLSEVM